MNIRALGAMMVATCLMAARDARGADTGRPGLLRLAQWNSTARVDWHLMRMQTTGMDAMNSTRGMLMAAEIETTATLNDGTRDIADFALQWPYATQMRGIDGRGRQMHFGNAYALMKLGLARPNIRIGQFVVPFGNLTSFETHTRPLQTMYAQSLGVRIDRGVSVEGMAGAFDYWVAAVAGNGPRTDNDGRPAFVARLARRYDLRSGARLSAGLSGLAGRAMPRFSPGVDPLIDHEMHDVPMEHYIDAVDKTRLGLDFYLESQRDTWRLELIGGRDSDGTAEGQFVQWSRALDASLEVGAQASRWAQPTGTRVALGAWVGRSLGNGTLVRAAIARGQGRLHGEVRRDTTVSLQFSREFALPGR